LPTPSLLTLIDDVASILDDVAVLTKVATKKTAGVLGDDLALNAQQVAGLKADRELPVVWAVAKGSLVNKAILVPAALAISAVVPWLITPLLLAGGAFLCFEGFEKIVHKLFHQPEERAERVRHAEALADQQVDLVALEQDKIKGAVRTDFVLSAEIIVIALGTVASAPFMTRVSVLVALSVILTVGVYGLVAGIVRLDDAGQYLTRGGSALSRGLGAGILRAAPWLMKGLGVAGTVAMFLVGGGIVTHAVPPLHDVIHHWSEAVGPLGAVLPTIVDLVAGLITGGIVLAAWTLLQRVRGKNAH
jgi:hypothetical protein